MNENTLPLSPNYYVVNSIRTGWVLIGTIGILFLGAVLFWCNPIEYRWFPPCFLHKLTGLYCPGCGSTRAFHALAHGNLSAALRFNPLAVLSFPAIGLLAWRRGNVSQSWVWTALCLAILFGILRNIPLQTFQVLRP